MIETLAGKTPFHELKLEDQQLIKEALGALPEHQRSAAEALVLRNTALSDGTARHSRDHLAEIPGAQTDKPPKLISGHYSKKRAERGPATRDSDDIVGLYLDEIGEYELLTAEQERELSAKVQAGLEAQKELRNKSVSGDVSEANRLEALAEEGRAAKEEFLNANLRLVVSIAKKYPVPEGMDLLDLIQEGNLGLEHAVEKFDGRKGFKFSTYATFWIRQGIGRAIDQKANLVRLPCEKAIRLRAALREVFGEGDYLNDEEMSKLHRLATPTSLNRHMSNDAGTELGDSIPDMTQNPENVVMEQMEIDAVIGLLDILDSRQYIAVRYRMGLEDGMRHSFTEVGERLGITAEAARRLTNRAIDRLKLEAAEATEAGVSRQ